MSPRPSRGAMLAAVACILVPTLSPLHVSPAQAATTTVVSLTVTDGHVSQSQYGRPVLHAHTVNATIYAGLKPFIDGAPH